MGTLVENKQAIDDPIGLMKQYKETKDVKLRNELVMHYSYIARIVAVQMNGVYANFAQAEDIVNQGIITLIACVERYDESKGVKFESYAFMRVRGSVIDFVRKQDWLPRRVRQASKEIYTVHDQLCNELMREPSQQEIADRMGIPINTLHKHYSEATNSVMLSFEELIQNVSQMDGLLVSFYDKNSLPENHIFQQELKALLQEAIENLTENERLAVTLYYYEHLKLLDISKILMVSEQRVSQIISKAIQKLRYKLEKYMKG
ncbi:FliA/WhiG family RNA polymerase sigma factor [Oscillospiraceae bacterium PP1C4]